MPELAALNLELRVSCEECDESFPLTGYAASYACPGCAATFEPDYSWLRNTYGDDQLLRGEELQMSTVGEHRIRDVGDPTCPTCNATFELTAIAPQLATGACACPHCDAAISVRVAPEPLATSGYEYLLAEDTPDGPADDRARPVVLRCPECDASLRVDGTSRTVPCAHCQADVYLPDGVWRKLHPKRKNRTFSAVFDPERLDAAIAIAADPATEPGILEELAIHLVYEVRDALSNNPATPAVALLAIADDPHGRVRQQVAEHPNAPPELFADLADSDDPTARLGLARNPASSPALLTKLAEDDDKLIRAFVAGNESTPPEVLVRLADDPEYVRVGAQLALNPCTPAEALARLAAHQDERCLHDDHRAFEDRDPDGPSYYDRVHVDRFGLTVHAILAVHPNLPAEALPTLANHKEAFVRTVIAADPRTPPETLKVLAKDRSESVSSAARANPSCPSWWRRLF